MNSVFVFRFLFSRVGDKPSHAPHDGPCHIMPEEEQEPGISTRFSLGTENEYRLTGIETAETIS